MNMKHLTMALALMFLVAGAAAQSLEDNLSDHSNDFTYNVSAPGSPAELGEQATSYVGFTGIGVLIICWIVFYSIPHRRGFNNLQSMISANFTTTAVSLLIFPMGWIGGEAVIFMFVVTAGSLGYSRATSSRGF